jgi:hypothetical protein
MHDKRIFTVEEANSLIPCLEVHFAKVIQLRGQVRATCEELAQAGCPPTEEALARTDHPPAVQRLLGRFRALLEALTEALAAIEDIGASVKDLEIGLCDFLGEREGRPVWLCWQYGEKQITWWHDLDAGFRSRQRIEDTGRSRPLYH